MKKKIKRIEVLFLDDDNCRAESHIMTAKIPIEVSPKRKLLAQSKELMKLTNKKSWSMTVKCTGGLWFVFHNKRATK